MELHKNSGGVEAIAIVGAGCHLPGNISTVEDLYAALRAGRDCIAEVPADRWDVNAHYDADPVAPGKTYVRYGGFVTGIDRFDAAFFGIPDAEAARMDPQQRIALQTVWHALENAGQSAAELAGAHTGVFLAMMNTNGYALLKNALEGLEGVAGYDAMGDAMSITAGRISHFLGVDGPCLALDTACSGSLVALHLARQSILVGECDSAIVVGVSAILHPGVHMAFSKLGLMSRTGRCKAFDEAADGYVRGEGCVAVLLRRESEAIARGDRIMARVVSTAINQDGHTPALTAPNAEAQEKVMRLALGRAGIDPREIGYVEAHGTGTPVGDPIEMRALSAVYGCGRSDDDPLFTGSAKSNFGHLESGAGLLGLVKAALSLERGVIFPSLHFHRWNPNIHLGGAVVRVPATPIPWPRGETPRLAGVNSFSYSGTNAHAILREAPLAPRDGAPAAPRPAELVVLSAKSLASLQELADRWVQFLAEEDSALPRDIAFTAACGRSHMRYRLAMVGRDKGEIREKLERWRSGPAQASAARKPKVAFVFSAEGSQYARMGRQLDATEPRFKAAIDECAGSMDAALGVPLRDVLFGRSSAELLRNTRYAQPALFAVEYALAVLLTDWGVQPDFVLGHGVGEIAAACAAGILGLDDAARLVVARGRLMASLPRGGKMLAVEATPAEAAVSLDGQEGELALAAVNGPHSIVISGEAQAVNAAAQLAEAAGRSTRELDASPAFHSPLMDPILGELGTVAASLRFSPGKIPMISCVTGELMDPTAGADYWSLQARRPVLFHRALQSLAAAAEGALLIEIGPHGSLASAVSGAFDQSQLRYVPALARDRQDVANLLETLAAIYVAGGPLDFAQLFSGCGYQRVALPLYPFRRDRYWIRGKEPERIVPEKKLHPLLGRAIAGGTHAAVFESSVSTTHPWVDHRVLGATVFPGAAYLEMAARAFAAAQGQDWLPVALRDVTFDRPLMLDYGKTQNLRITLAGGHFTVTGDSETYCRGRIEAAGEDRPAAPPKDIERGVEIHVGRFYGELRKSGLEYGAGFSTVRSLWAGEPNSGQATGRITGTPSAEDANAHAFMNTTMLDGCLQVFGAALKTLAADGPGGAFVPASIQSMIWRRPLPFEVCSRVLVRTNHDGSAATAAIGVEDGAGNALAEIAGLELRRKSILTATQAPVPREMAESRDQLVSWLRGLPQEQRAGGLADWLSAEVKVVLGQAAGEIDLDHIDPSIAFLEIGLDSLSVTELQRRIQEKLEFRFQPMQGLDYQSIESLSEYILNEVLIVEPA